MLEVKESSKTAKGSSGTTKIVLHTARSRELIKIGINIQGLIEFVNKVTIKWPR